MSKPFFNVFTTLKLNKNLHALMEQMTVERVSATKSGDYLRIYVHGEHLIEKQKIVEVEEEIAAQLFRQKNTVVKLYDTYNLSKQYNLKNLFAEYFESILWELQRYNHIHYVLLKKADIRFVSDTNMVLTVENTELNKDVQKDVVRILDKIIHDRCGLPVEIEVEYKEPQTSRYAKESKIKVEKQISDILSRIDNSEEEQKTDTASDANAGNTDKKMAKDTSADKNNKQVNNDKQSNGNKNFNYKKSEYKRFSKKSDNPDVIYGRDFDDEFIKIE